MSIPKSVDYPMPDVSSFPANRVGWKIEPSRAVLLIHDMQVYFLRFYAPGSPLLASVLENLVRLREWAHQHQVPVVYTAQLHTQTAQERGLLSDLWGPGLSAHGPEEQAIIAPLTPTAQDIVLDKWRYSAFQKSDLLARMHGWKRDQLMIGGVFAHVGCMMTAVDAFMQDIQPFLIGDAVADFSENQHRMALAYVTECCGQVLATPTITGVLNE